MNKEVTILMADDDDGHSSLVKKNLKRAGIINEIIRFKDGQETLDFFFGKSKSKIEDSKPYLLILDIKMPKMNGFDVLKKLKGDDNYKKMPIIMLTTTDNPDEIEKCHLLGCSNYITKPVEYQKFVEIIRQLGLFISIIEIPKLEENSKLITTGG